MKKYSEIIHYLKKDTVLQEAIKQLDLELKPELDIDVHALLRAIVSQQLSVKVADIIFIRFIDLFVNRCPKAEYIWKIVD